MNCITRWLCCCSRDESSHNQKQTSSKSNKATTIALSSIGTNSSSPSKLNKYSIGKNRRSRSSDENSAAFKSTSKSLLIFSRKNSDSSMAQAFIKPQAFHNTSEMLINDSQHLPIAHVEPSNEGSSTSSLDISQSDPQEQSLPLASSKIVSKSQIPGTRTLEEILKEADGLQVNIDYNIPHHS